MEDFYCSRRALWKVDLVDFSSVRSLENALRSLDLYRVISRALVVWEFLYKHYLMFLCKFV